MKIKNAATAENKNHQVKGNNGIEVLNRVGNILIDADKVQFKKQQMKDSGVFIDADAVQITCFSIRPRAMTPILEA